PVFSRVAPDRHPVAAHQIHLVAFLGLCVSQRVERGVGNHLEPGRIRISNYFCLGTYRSSANANTGEEPHRRLPPCSYGRSHPIVVWTRSVAEDRSIGP